MDILWFVLIGIVAGWLAGVIMKGRGFGIVGDLIVGVLGAVIGGLLFDLLNISVGGTAGSLFMAVIGAIILLALVSGLKKRA